jgi:pimeloyl-ACP methyl ester carboxylesterase
MVMLFSAHRLGPVSPASCRCGDYNWALTAPWDGAQITPPALILAGDRDPVISSYDTSTLEASLRALIPNLRRFELVPGAGCRRHRRPHAAALRGSGVARVRRAHQGRG